MTEITTFDIPDLCLLRPRQFGDDRGFFSEVFRADWLPAERFVQDNHSLSAKRGTVRGLHFQRNPRAQGKLVRVVAGAILDVAVDIREGSPTYGRHVAVELSAKNWSQLWVPAGFLHGFCTLTEATEVVYKVTDYYSPEHDAAVAWNDPDIGIAWPVSAEEATVSAKDAAAPRLSAIGPQFRFGG